MPSTQMGPLGVSQQRLIDAYLADLRRCLHGVDPAEAEDIEESIIEHITSALAASGSPSVENVQEILNKLGPVERIVSASDVRAAAAAPVVLGSPASSSAGVSAGAVVLLVLAVVALVFSGFWFIGGPLGLLVGVGGMMSARGAATSRGLYRVAAWVGACAVVVSIVFALVLTSAKTTVSPDEPAVVTSSTAMTVPTSR